jgi:SAM-dependent methyltransferase
MCDLGCGKEGLDLEWWATREVDDDERRTLLNINCTGIDKNDKLTIESEYKNITYIKHDLEEPLDQRFDVLWCHNRFQYILNPLQTLKNWNSMLTEGGMLVMNVPQTTNITYNKQDFTVPNKHYFNYTISNLIYMLSVNGFDCRAGFFQQEFEDPWIKIVVYKSKISPMDPKLTGWYDLLDLDLLPKSVNDSINKYGYLQQKELVLTWLDKTNIWFGQ